MSLTLLDISSVDRHEAVWEPGRTVPLAAIMGVLHRGSGDPTMVIKGRQVWWAVQTPQGATASWWRTHAVDGCDRVEVTATGDGGLWLIDRIRSILGNEDDVSGFTPHHDVVAHAWGRPMYGDWRVTKTGLVLNSLIPTILEQKVTGKQAFGAFRHLVRAYGEPAPFPADVVALAGDSARQVHRMMCPPTVAQWRRIPSWQWLKAGVEPSASATVMRALESSAGLERLTQLPWSEAHQRLRTIPGVGVWTAAKVAQTAWGDPDAPTFGDFHIAKRIGWALDGRDGDDARMAQLLEPYRGHRYRAERILLQVAPTRGARGPRMELPSHTPGWSD